MKRAKCTSRPHNKAFLRTNIHKNEKASPERLACCVDYTGRISNLLEDLWKVERFMQYIENQGSENMIEMEGSER